MDGYQWNFSILDGRDCQAIAAVNEVDPPNVSVLSTARAFVDQQQFICYGIRQFLQNRE
jgi:hypothetical protein